MSQIQIHLKQGDISPNEMGREIEYYKKRNPGLSGLLHFYQAIFEVQRKYISRIEPQVYLDEEGIRARLKEGRSLFRDEDIIIDSTLFRQLLEELCEVIKAKSKFKGKFSKLLSSEELKPEKMSDFIRNLKQTNIPYLMEFSKKVKLNMDILFFLVQNALIPFYERHAREVRDKIDYALWRQGFCPICGRKPLIAKFREEDGLRLLQCSLCRTQWCFLRVKCPFCGNSDHESLQYFYSEGDRGHRADVCEMCKRYIKTSDERELQRKVILEIEDVAGVHLDTFAKEQGYIPGAQYIAEMNR